MNQIVNVGLRLAATAARDPDGIAVVEPAGRDASGKRRYRQCTFRQLEDDSNLLADGLRWMGVSDQTRMVLMVRPSTDFISLVFALFKAGAVTVLIDPGMGRKNLVRCLAESEPEGFVAIPLVQAIRSLLRRRFPKSRYHVTAGRRWFWGGATLEQLRTRRLDANFQPAASHADDPAAIIFTTGSTGPPKGTLYTHGNFDRQVDELRDFYDIRAGELDLPGFPLFGLFNCAMGVTWTRRDRPRSTRRRSSRRFAIGTSPRPSARRPSGTWSAVTVKTAGSCCLRCAACCPPARRCRRTSCSG